MARSLKTSAALAKKNKKSPYVTLTDVVNDLNVLGTELDTAVKVTSSAQGIVYLGPDGLPLKSVSLRLADVARRSQNGLAILSPFGNSIVAGVSSRKIFDAAIARNGAQYIPGANYGVAGNTSAQILARVSSVAGNAAILSEGPNDADGAVSVAAHRDTYEQIITGLLTKGIAPSISLSSPRTGKEGTIAAYCAVETMLAAKYGIDLFDPWVAASDPATGAWASGNSADGVHPNTATSDTATTSLAAQIADPDSVVRWRPRASTAGVAGYLLSGGNNLMTTSASSVPTGWSMVGGTPTTQAIITAPAGYLGNFAQMTSNAGGGNPYLRKIIAGGFQAGDELLVTFALQYVSATNSNLTVSMTGGVASVLLNNIAWDMPAGRHSFRVTATSVADITLFVQLGNVGTGGVVAFGEVEIYNLTALASR